MNAQNVGIGTNNPTDKLTVSGVIGVELNSNISQPHLRMFEPEFDYSRIMFLNDATKLDWTIAGRPADNPGDAKLNFFTSSFSNGNVMSLTGLGRAGINVSNPAATLHTNSVSGTDPLRIQNNNSTKFRIFSNNAMTFGINWANPIPDAVRFITPHFFIGFASNHVPTEKFEVDGTVKATGFSMPTGAVNGYYLRSDASGNASWQPVSSGGASKWTFTANDSVSPVANKDVCIGCDGTVNRSLLAIGEGGLADEAVKIKTDRQHALLIESDHNFGSGFAIGSVAIKHTGTGMSAIQVEGQDQTAPSMRVLNVGFGPAASFKSFFGTNTLSASNDADNGIAGSFSATNGVNVIGARGFGYYGLQGQSSESSGAGVRGINIHSGTGFYFGGYFEAFNGGDNGVGLYARGALRGIEANGGDFDFYASGAGVNYGSGSSRRWKTDIRNIDDPIAKLKKLRGLYYTWDAQHGGQHDLGFIAEEVAEVLPEIVVYSEDGKAVDGLDYSKMTPLLLEGLNVHIK